MLNRSKTGIENRIPVEQDSFGVVNSTVSENVFYAYPIFTVQSLIYMGNGKVLIDDCFGSDHCLMWKLRLQWV